MTDAVRATSDFNRILKLPRRDLSTSELDALAVDMTDALRRPGGTMSLRRLQALALAELGTQGGAFCALDVGQGKTLITLLAAWILGAERPLFLLPANLIKKTAREWEELAKHWLIPTNIRLFSYQMLGLADYALELEKYKPDLIIADECHKLKNPGTALTRRVDRYMAANPSTKFLALTGTIMRTSIRDFAHVLRWCLKDGAPVPLDDEELFSWCSALDEKPTFGDEFSRYEPGALMQFANADERAEPDERTGARRAYRRRLADTPGVITTGDQGEKVETPIEIRALTYDLSATTASHFKRLREDLITPDEWQLWGPVDVWRHAKELSLGYHQIWEPRPPEDWRLARKEWFAFVRAVLQNSRAYDSPEQVARACDAGELPSHKLERWRQVEPDYKIQTKAIWHDDGALKAAAQWMAEGPGIVWTEHVPFALRLAEMTGATYYGAKGLSSDGRFVDDAGADEAIIVSVDANREGRNLQKKWWRNLVTSPPEGADIWQQMIGRTHRTGQTAPRVVVDVFLGCAEHARAMARALIGAKNIRDTVGAESKLMIAELDWPDDIVIASWSGPRWDRAA